MSGMKLKDAVGAHFDHRDKFGTGNLVGELGEQIAAAVLGAKRAEVGAMSADLLVDPPAEWVRPAAPLGIEGMGSAAPLRVDYASYYGGDRVAKSAKNAYRRWLTSGVQIGEVKCRVSDFAGGQSAYLRSSAGPRSDYFPTFDFIVIVLFDEASQSIASCRKVTLHDWVEWVATPHNGSRMKWDYKIDVMPDWIGRLGEDLTGQANAVLAKTDYVKRSR